MRWPSSSTTSADATHGPGDVGDRPGLVEALFRSAWTCTYRLAGIPSSWNPRSVVHRPCSWSRRDTRPPLWCAETEQVHTAAPRRRSGSLAVAAPTVVGHARLSRAFGPPSRVERMLRARAETATIGACAIAVSSSARGPSARAQSSSVQARPTSRCWLSIATEAAPSTSASCCCSTRSRPGRPSRSATWSSSGSRQCRDCAGTWSGRPSDAVHRSGGTTRPPTPPGTSACSTAPPRGTNGRCSTSPRR